jgi:hypothetical protein
LDPTIADDSALRPISNAIALPHFVSASIVAIAVLHPKRSARASRLRAQYGTLSNVTLFFQKSSKESSEYFKNILGISHRLDR